MGTIKQPYELSVWEDIIVPKSGDIEEHFTEQRLATIGAHDLDAPTRAFNVTLKEGINGERTLTFDLLRKIKDHNGEIIDNPFLGMIVNESKVKLRIGEDYIFNSDPVTQSAAFEAERASEDVEDKWIDFIIKDIDEDRQGRISKYIAKELYVNELGKNGYATLLDTELENNYGTIVELANKVLDSSGWIVNPSSYSPTERIAQPLFRTRISSNLSVKRVLGDTTIIINAHDYIYPLYDYVQWDTTLNNWVFRPIDGRIQFLWKGNNLQFDRNDTNDDRLITDDNFDFNFYVTASTISIIENLQMTGLNGSDSLRGNRIIRTTNSRFENVTGQFVNEYKVTNASAGRPVGSIVFSTVDTEYLVSSIVTNYLTNSTNFTSNLAWSPQNETWAPYAQVLPYPDGGDPSSWLNSNPTNYLQLDIAGVNRSIFNEGPSNTGARMALVQDKVYVVRVKARMIAKNVRDYGFNGANISTTAQPIIQVSLGTYSPSAGFSARTNSASINLFSGINTSSTDMSIRGYGNPNSRVAYTGVAADSSARVDEDRYVYVYLKANESTRASLDRIHLRIVNLGTNATHDYNIEDIQLFDYVTDENNRPIFLGDIPSAAIKQTRNFFYINGEKQQIMLSQNESFYEPVYKENYQSVRHLDIKESNYFNNINALAELFEVWVKFKVYHQKDGKVLLGSDKQPRKEVIFSQFAPNGDVVNWAGFKYGINLSNIKRRRDSNGLATKVIVKNNNQEFAVDGMASIARAHDNPSGENEVFNFDYYVNQGLLDYTQMLRDLFGMSSLDMGTSTRLRALNDVYMVEARLLQSYLSEIAQSEAFEEAYREAMDSAVERISHETFLFNSYAPTDTVKREERKAVILQLQAQLRAFTVAREAYSLKIQEYTKKRDDTQDKIDVLLEQKKKIKFAFHRKYSRFIQEGTWTDDKYIDDDLYYLDAVKIASIGAFPKASYAINVVDISSVEGFAAYNFTIGTRTYIEDTEFFGWTLQNPGGQGATRTPFKMEVIVSERSRNFDDPNKSTLTVQNYKSQFEELFSQVVAATTQLQYQSGSYERAAAAITPDGEIQITTLEKALMNNAFTIANAKNQNVTWDSGRGIEVTDLRNSSEMVRITSGGIFMTIDGGRTWINGISGAGINTNHLLAGQIDASRINILSNGMPIFRWDAAGISAFKTEGLEYNTSHFVRFNQFGLFGTIDGNELNQAVEFASTFDDKLEAIRNNSTFSLTWEGLLLRSQEGSVSLTPEGGFEVYNPNWLFPEDTIMNYPYTARPDGLTRYEVEDRIPIVSLGRFFDTVGDEPYYGLRMRNKKGHITLRTESDGNLWLSNSLSVGSANLIEIVEPVTQMVTSSMSGNRLIIDIETEPEELAPIGTITSTVTGASFGYNRQHFSEIELGQYRLTLPLSALDNGSIPLPMGESEMTFNIATQRVHRFLGINGAVELQSEGINNDPIVLYAGNMDEAVAPFQLHSSGRLRARDVHLTGNINAESGNFSGQVTIGSLSGIDGSYNATYAYWAGSPDLAEVIPKFFVTPAGALYATDTYIEGNGRFTGYIEATDGLFRGLITALGGRFDGQVFFGGSDSYIGVAEDSNLFININRESFGVDPSGNVFGSSLLLSRNHGWEYSENLVEKYNIIIGEQGDGNHVMEIFNPTTSASQIERVFGIMTDGAVSINGILRTSGDLIFEGALRSSNNVMRIDGSLGSITVKTPAVDGWGIYGDGSAHFSDIDVRGKISSAVFEYNRRSSIAGELVVSPSIHLLEPLENTYEDDMEVSYDLFHLINDAWINISNVIVNVQGVELRGSFQYPILTLTTEEMTLAAAFAESTVLPQGTQVISTSIYTNTIVLNAKDPRGGFIAMRGPSNLGVRYVRDWLKSSAIGAPPRWSENMIYNLQGENIAHWIVPQANFEPNTDHGVLEVYTNGIASDEDFVEAPDDKEWYYIELDLEKVFYDLTEIETSHITNPNVFYEHKIEVSTDGVNWTTVYSNELTPIRLYEDEEEEIIDEEKEEEIEEEIPVEPSVPDVRELLTRRYLLSEVESEASAVLIGNLVPSQLPTSAIEYFGSNLGYGLYADNVYLTGKVYLPKAGITNEENRYYQGVEEDGKQIRFWAGTAASDMENAPFIVTQDGTMYAKEGRFEGEITTTSGVFSGYLIAAGVLIDPERMSDQFFVTNPFEGERPTPDEYILNMDKNGLSIWEGGLHVFSDYYSGWRGDEKTGPRNPFYGYDAELNPNPWPIMTIRDGGTFPTHVPRIAMVHNHTWIRQDNELLSTRVHPGSIRFSDLTLESNLSDYTDVEQLLWNEPDRLKIGHITVNGEPTYGLQAPLMHFSDENATALTIRPRGDLQSGQMINNSLTTVHGFFNFGDSIQVSQEVDGIIFTYIGSI